MKARYVAAWLDSRRCRRGKAFFITWAIVIPMLVYPWWAVLGAYVFFTMITSLIMATTFQLAHCVEEASFASADELRAERRIWAVHEVETTVDFCLAIPFSPGCSVGSTSRSSTTVPEGATHPLSEDRRDRPAQLRQARRSLLVQPSLGARLAVTLSPPAGDGTTRAPSRIEMG